MVAEHAEKIVAELLDAFPQAATRTNLPSVFTRYLRDLDYKAAMTAVEELILNSESFPTIAAIRRHVVEQRTAIPTALEAWAAITEPKFENDPRELHPLVERVRSLFGGSYSIKNSDSPSITRAQFLKTYDEFREEELRRENVSHWRRSA